MPSTYFSLTGHAEDLSFERLNNAFAQLRKGRAIVDDERANIHELPFRIAVTGPPGIEPRLPAFQRSCQFMSHAFVTALRVAGVDSLQTFPLVLEHEGRAIGHHCIVNLTADLGCKVAGEAPEGFAPGLVIDPTRARDTTLFRLAETRLHVLVHRRIVEQLDLAAFEGVHVQPVAERIDAR